MRDQLNLNAFPLYVAKKRNCRLSLVVLVDVVVAVRALVVVVVLFVVAECRVFA